MNQHLRSEPVAFIDIGAQRRRLGTKIDDAVARVLTHCQFINGPEVTQLEADLAAYCGAKHVVACASGTDALLMVLMAQGGEVRKLRADVLAVTAMIAFCGSFGSISK